MSLNLPAELAPLPDEFKDIFDNYALRKTCTEESIQPVDEIDGNSSSDSNNEVGVIPEYLDNWFTKHENLLECQNGENTIANKLENIIACRKKLFSENNREQFRNRRMSSHKKVDSYKLGCIDDILSGNEEDE